MDKNQQEVLNGLIHSIEDLKRQLQALEERVAAFADDLPASGPATPSFPAETQSEPGVSPAMDDAPMDWSDTEIGVIEIPEQVRSDDHPAEAQPEPASVAEPEPIAETVAEPVSAPVPEPAAELEPASVPEPAPVAEPEPAPVAEPEPAPEPVAEPAEAPVAESVVAPVPEPFAEPVAESVEAPAEVPAPLRGKSLADLAAERLAWKSDFPGISVKNIRSAISLIDRAQFIAKLFNEDFALYDKTISELNELTTLDEAVRYVTGHFPDWNLSSDLVYSFMMAIRKKLG